MPTYQLTSPKTGQRYRVQAGGELSPQDAEAAVNHYDSVYEQNTANKSFAGFGDTLSGIGSMLGGLPTTVPAAYYGVTEGFSRPDQYSPEARAAFDANAAYQQRMQQESQNQLMRGEATSAGDAFREAGPSLGFTVGSMAGAIPAGMAAGALAGTFIEPGGGTVGGGLIGAAASGIGAAVGAGTVAYRMAGQQFLNDAFNALREQRGGQMSEEEMQQAYNELLPLAENSALWEAGPEAIGNAASLGAAKIVFGLGKPLITNLAKTALGKAGVKVGAIAGSQAVELGTETATALGQGVTQAQADAYARGDANWQQARSPYDRPGGTLQAFQDIAPATLALGATTLGAGGVVKLATLPFQNRTNPNDPTSPTQTPAPTDDTGELTAEDVEDLETLRLGDLETQTLPTPGAGAIRPQPGASRVTEEGSIPSTAPQRTARFQESSINEEPIMEGDALTDLRIPRSPEAIAESQRIEAERQQKIATMRMLDARAQGMPLIPDSPSGSRDILDFANENPIYLPPGFSEQRNLPEYEKLKEAKLPPYWRQFVASSKRGGNPSDVAQRAFDAGFIDAPTADAYLEAVRGGIEGRQQYRVQFAQRDKALQQEEKQVVAFEKTQDKLARQPDTEQVAFEDIRVGDRMLIDDEPAVVRNVEYDEDGYLTNVVIEDGKRFGLQQFDPQTRAGILVDEYQPAPRRAVAEEDFTPAEPAGAGQPVSDPSQLFDVAPSTRPANRGETARPQNADPLGELTQANRAGEAERAQQRLDLPPPLQNPASSATRPSRQRPKNQIVFNSPIPTPAGFIRSYSWASKIEEIQDKTGEVVEKRFSDWDKAVTNAETGRDIVHQFDIEKSDGTITAVSLESALGKLTPEVRKNTQAIIRAARRLPLRQAELQQLQTQQASYDAALQSAQQTGWQNAPEPRLETPEFPPLAERGVKAVYVGNEFIKNLEVSELNQFNDLRQVVEWKRQWAVGQVPRLPYGTRDRIDVLKRGIRKDMVLLPASSNQPQASSNQPPPLMLPSNRLGRGLADMMPGGVPSSRFQVPSSGQLETSNLKPATLASAYTTAARGQSSQMLPLAEVFAAAQQQNPALTPQQFQAQVMAEYEAGTVLLEGSGSRQEAESAGLRIDGTPVGTAVRMMVVGNPALQNPVAVVTPAQDAAYLAAVEAGDMATAQRMVDEAAQAAGYNSGMAFHGTSNQKFTSFDPSKANNQLLGKGFYFIDSERESKYYGPNTIRAYLKLGNAAEVDTTKEGETLPDFSGFDSTVAKTHMGKVFRVATPNQIKSADPVTRDDQGNVIPLSQRFNPESPSILYSPSELAANQKANESILRNLGLPTAKGTRVWGGKKIQAALAKLATDERYPATTRRMAQELAARPLDNLLLKIEADARLNWAGLYQPFNDGRGELSLNTRTMGRGELDIGISLVHEVLHHATYQALRNPKTARQKQAAKDLQALYTRAKAALAANEQLSQFDYELSNVDEFITGLWTRADFQTALAGIPADTAPTLGQRVRSMLDEIFRVLAELVTRKEVAPGSVLEASMAASLRIMEDGRTQVETEAMLAPLQNPAAPAPNETQSRFASPNPADRVINGPRTDELVTAEANAWLNSLDQQAAIEAFVAGQVPLSLDTAERAAATLIADLSEQAATAKTEVARMWAHVQGRRMARVWTTEHLSADPARALRQRGVVNNTILAPIAPVLAAQELLEDRAKKVIDNRFDGGTEGAVEKVKDVATTAGEQAGTDLAADLEGETTPGAPTRPGQPPRTRKLGAKHPNLKKMLDALRKKMFPGMTWADIFTQLPETQKERQREIYRRLMLDERLRNLTPQERLALTNELDKAWMRERRKVFMRELEKAGVLGETKPKDREKVKAAAPRLLRLMNLGMLNSEMFREALAKEYGLNMIDAAAAADLRALGERIQKAPEGLPRRKLEQQLVERLQKLSGYTLWQVIDSWWTASVLSGWRTPVDIGLGVANGIEDIGLGSIVAALRSGNKDVAVRGLSALFGRIPSAFMEAVDHVATGNKAMMRSFELEVKQAMEGGNLLASDVGRQMWDRGGWRKVPGGFMVFYGRLMTALDHVNSSSTREGAKALALARHPDLYQKALRISAADRAAARQQARLELTGGAVPATQQERIEEAARVREILEQGIPAEMLAEATEVGRAAALQGEPTGLGGALLDAVLSAVSVVNRKAQQLAARDNPDLLTRQGAVITAAMVPLARAITGTKFARTVAHALNRTTSYVPGVGLYTVGQQGRTGAFGDILAARQVIGTLVGIALYLAFDDDDDEKGIEDGWKDKTPQQKAQLYAQGKQPFTVWERDAQGRVRSWNYQQWGIAGIVNTVAQMHKQKGSEAGTLNVLMNSVVMGAMSFTDKAQLQGLQTVLGAEYRSTDPASGIAANLNKYAAQTVGGLVPRLVKDIDMVASPELRSTTEWWQKWAKEVPMLRQLSSGKRIDILGQDINLVRGPLSRVTQLGTADPVYRLLGKLNARDVWLSDPSQGVRVVKLADGTRRNMNPTEKDRYQRLTGAAYRAYLEKEGPALMQMSPEDAQEAVSKATARLRATAAYQATH